MFRNYGPAITWAVIILILCGLPGKDLPDINFWEWDIEDKLAHIAVFGLLGILTFRARYLDRSKSFNASKEKWLIIFMGVLYAAFTEIMQGLVFMGRSASVKDFIADSIGMILGTIIANLWYITRSQ